MNTVSTYNQAWRSLRLDALSQFIKNNSIISLTTNSKTFGGLSHWIFTNPSIIDIELSYIVSLRTNNETICVILNLEFVIELLHLGVPNKYIHYWADCTFKAEAAANMGIPEESITIINVDNHKDNIKNMKKTVDYVITNIPFSKFSQFKEMINKVTNQKSVMISSAASYAKKQDFKYVTTYRHLGKVFPGVKTVASVVIMDHIDTPEEIKFIGSDSEQNIQLSKFSGSPPSNNLSESHLECLNVPNARYYNKGELQQNEITVDGDISNGGKNYVWRDNYNHPDNGTEIMLGSGQYGVKYNDPDCYDSHGGAWSERTWTTIDTDLLNDSDGHLYDKVILSKQGSVGKTSTVKFIPKGVACARSVWWIKVDSELEAQYIVEYFNHPTFKAYIRGMLSTKAAFTRPIFETIPHHYDAHKWIDDIEDFNDYITTRN